MPRTANKPAHCWKCSRSARLYYIAGADVNVCGRCLAVCKSRIQSLNREATKRRNQLEAEVAYMMWENRRWMRR
jgi:ferredoxin